MNTISVLSKEQMITMLLEGKTYQQIADKANVSRQRVQQIISPPAQIRDFVINKYNNNCFDCGINTKHSGHIHHQSDCLLEDFNDINNLVLLCISCHRKRHIGSLYKESNYESKVNSGDTISVFKCKRPQCGHEWPSKQEHPTVCPKCKSPYWDKGRK